jgi:gas vesicle protein
MNQISKPMNQLKKEDIYDKLGNIDQIRDIIFGSQLRDYNTRFDKLESDLANFRQELIDRIQEVKTTNVSELRSALDTVDKRIKALQLTGDEERNELRQIIDRTHRKSSSNFEKLSEDLEATTGILRDNLNESKAKLQDDIRGLRNYVQEELERRLSAIGNIKVSRDDMAEILFELGMRLKGTEFVPELEEATDLIIVDRMGND